MMTSIPLKIVYIGGGRRESARKLMIDLALCPNLIGKVTLTENTDLAFQAFFNDPSNSLPIDIAWEPFNKLLELNHQFLPEMAVA